MQIEKDTLDNCSNLPAKSAFILHKDHLRHNMLSGQLACLSFHLKQRSSVRVLYFGCCSALVGY